MKKFGFLILCSLLLFTGCGEKKEKENDSEIQKVRDCCLEAGGNISNNNTCSFNNSVSDKTIYDTCMNK